MNTDPDLRDLRQYSSQQLRPLLEAESHVWSERLLWDYEQSTEMLLQYLDQHILPGLVALHPKTRKVMGYCFCVYEAQKAVIGDLYVSPRLAEETAPGLRPAAVRNTLLQHLIQMLQFSPGVDRIESQLLIHESGTIAAPFVEHGFQIHRRIFMERTLQPVKDDLLLGRAEQEPLLPGLKLQRWVASNFNPAGSLIHRAYVGHSDSSINDQYTTVQGSLRFLHNVVRFPGCGFFDAEASFVLVEEGSANSGVLQGMVLASRVQPEVAHITQLCVAPELRGQHLGRLLLQQTASNLARREYRSMTLTVTESNTAAIQLYRELGFTTRHTFDAMVWQR